MTFRTTHSLPYLAVIVIVIAFLNTTDMDAQSVSRQVIGVAGGEMQQNDVLINWTLGESIVGMSRSPKHAYSVNAGFQQPHLSISPEFSDPLFSIMIAPNPTPDWVNVVLSDPTQQNLYLSLVNVQGQVLVPKLQLNPWKNEINLSNYPSGTYYLRVSNQEDRTQVYKIIKQ